MTYINSLGYAPHELNFGTSGLRGLETDMTDLECYINVCGFIDFLETEHSLTKGTSIAIAGDLRKSTPRILCAVSQAIVDSGYTTEYCGLIPTPALAYYAFQNKIPSIMVTGSHIPADRNGIKFYRADSEVMKSDEAAIKSSVIKVRENIYSSKTQTSLFDSLGKLIEPNSLPSSSSGVLDNFHERYTSVFPSDIFKKKHIIVYQHSAVGRDFLVEMLEELGASVTPVQRSETFVSIDTENVTPADQLNFLEISKQYPDSFAVISTDGDSDRPFVIDETGTFRRGDILGAIVAVELGAQLASLPISSSDADDKVLADNGVSFTHTKIGSPYVIEQMELDAQKGISVGWEVNGGFMTSSDIEYGNGTLVKLPTRDAFLPILIALSIASKQKISVSEIFSSLPHRYTQAGLLDHFPQETSQKIIEILSKKDSYALKIINQIFTKEHGFDGVEKIDTTDGIKIYFVNRDIAHIRPSGNAPQLRIYATSDSQRRADKIVESSVVENGLLSSLQKYIH